MAYLTNSSSIGRARPLDPNANVPLVYAFYLSNSNEREINNDVPSAIVTLAQFWLTGRTSFLVCRALLGFIQGGFIPDLILYLSCASALFHLYLS